MAAKKKASVKDRVVAPKKAKASARGHREATAPPGEGTAGGHRFKVEEFLVDAPRKLITIGPDDGLWKGIPHMGPFPGTIFRLRPPASAVPELVDSAVAALTNMGAARVIVERARKAEHLPSEAVERKRAPMISARQVVEQLVAESAYPDKAALASITERAMAENGL